MKKGQLPPLPPGMLPPPSLMALRKSGQLPTNPAPQPQPHQNPTNPNAKFFNKASIIEVGMPNPTVYISNLDDRLNPKRVLIPSLRALFEPFGRILRITCRRALLMKGQAWIEMDTLESAQTALSSLQGRRLFNACGGKSMILKYARAQSLRQAARAGRARQARDAIAKRRKERAMAGPRVSKRAALSQAMANPALMAVLLASNFNGPSSPALNHLGAAAVSSGALMQDIGLPNKTLFLQNLPFSDESQTAALTKAWFARFPGFDEVRAIPGRPDVAFVEFGTEVQAAQARAASDGQPLVPNTPGIRATFARK